MIHARALAGAILIAMVLSSRARGGPIGLSVHQRVTVDGIGPVRIGMTVQEAATAAGTPFVNAYAMEPSEGCYYLRAKNGPSGIEFMVTDDRISRVDISNPEIRTVSGARIGDTEKRLKSLYAARIAVEAHHYSPDTGHYVTIYPNRERQVVFETEDGVVTTYRAGKVPEVHYVEGCS